MLASVSHRDKRLVCPYNAAHSIDPLRMAKHLMKCKKQYPNVRMSTCPFNATHHVREENLPSHLRECKDKAIVEKALFIQEHPNVFVKPNECSDSLVKYCKNGEDWGVETENFASYNPDKNIVYKEISRIPPTGLGKAGRRLWRTVDCARIQRLKSGLAIDDLVYPTPDGGEISISQIVSGRNNCGRYVEGVKSVPSEVSSMSVIGELPALRKPKHFKPKIAANIFEGMAYETSSEARADVDELSDISSINSKANSYNGAKIGRQKYMDLLRITEKRMSEGKLQEISNETKIKKVNKDNGFSKTGSNGRSVETIRRIILNSLSLD